MANEIKDAPPSSPAEKGWFGRQAAKAADFAGRQAFRTARFAVRKAAQIYGVNASGMEHFAALKNQAYVITPKHLSMFDAIVLAAMLPVEPAIAIDQLQYDKFMGHWWSRPFMKQVNLFPINPENAHSLKSLTRLVQAGKPVLIFPEGRLTDDTNLSAIMAGASTVCMNTGKPFLAVDLDGLQRLPFGTRTPGPHRWLPKIRVMVTEPRLIEPEKGLAGAKRREAGRRELEKVMQELSVRALDKHKSLIDALHEAAGNYGMKRGVLDDVNAQNVNYKTILQKSYGLGGKLAEITKKGENVGVLLPTSIGAVVTLFGLNAFGRVFAPLNVGAEIPELLDNSVTASMKTILTSRAMIEKMGEKPADKAKIDAKLAALGKNCKIVYLEDLRDSVGKFDKIKAGLRAHGLFRPADRPDGQDHALTIFTSGSEGKPKGVAHSSYSLLANVEQVHAVTPIEPDQKVFNVMPIFHAFGLTGGVLMPLLNGMPSYQFPSPLRAREIPPLIYHYKANIMFGTDTFLSLYERNMKEKYKEKFFSRLNMVFAGAEAVKQKTRDAYYQRFGLPIYEGYGRSEAAPVVSINVPGANTNGTLGRLLPGMEARFEEVPGFTDGKRLFLRGPNQMMGYIRNDKPGIIQPLEDGWDDTGDIIAVDSEEYLIFKGRAKRLTKVGGQYVVLLDIDRAAQLASKNPKSEHFSIDGNDKVVLFTTDPQLKSADVKQAAQELKISPLGLPKPQDIHYLKEMPHLGTGKPDGMKLKDMYNKIAANTLPGADSDADTDPEIADQAALPTPPPAAPPPDSLPGPA